MTIWNYLKKHILRNATQTICEDNRSMSFEKMIIEVELLSKKLRGVKCCAIQCSSEMNAAIVLLACLAAQVTAVPLSKRYGETHCNKIIDFISPSVIVQDPHNEIMLYVNQGSQYIAPSQHPALIMCTSGTTGRPKGVMLSEKNIITNLSDISEYFQIDNSDSILISRPLYHCAVLTGEFLTALINGARIQFYSDKFNPFMLLDAIKRQNITIFCGTPTMLSAMARFNRDQVPTTLKKICISGECMNVSVGKKIRSAFSNCSIFHLYGLTEASPRVSYLPPEYFADYPDCVGVPLKSTRTKILDEMGRCCSTNVEGVLHIKGKNIMIGYYNNPELTKKVRKKRWLCTGDMAIINDAGFLKILGRADDLIIKAGINIYPSEIEDALKQDSRVEEVLVYGVPQKYGTTIGMKLVGDFSSVEEIINLCMEVLPPFQVPSNIELVDCLPKNGSGKLSRREIS